MYLIIWLARILNISYYHIRSVLEKIGVKTDWAKEIGRYYHLPEDKIIAIYAKKRLETARLWRQKKRTSEKAVQSFYQETDYFVFRQNYFHRLKIYLDLAVPMTLKCQGKFCEYGGGVGPFTYWLRPLFPGWQFQIVDLDCPVFDFAKWRFKNKAKVSFVTVTPKILPLKDQFDVITCKQVLEHVSQPLKVVKHLVGHLNSGGWIYLDYINEPGEENLIKGAKQRHQTLKYLKETLKPVLAIDPDSREEGYGLYLKP